MARGVLAILVVLLQVAGAFLLPQTLPGRRGVIQKGMVEDVNEALKDAMKNKVELAGHRDITWGKRHSSPDADDPTPRPACMGCPCMVHIYVCTRRGPSRCATYCYVAPVHQQKAVRWLTPPSAQEKEKLIALRNIRAAFLTAMKEDGGCHLIPIPG
jgi:hypothetical protein